MSPEFAVCSTSLDANIDIYAAVDADTNISVSVNVDDGTELTEPTTNIDIDTNTNIAIANGQLSPAASYASLASTGPSLTLENILSVPGPRTREEMDREEAKEKALEETLSRTTHIESLLEELTQQHARQQALQEDEKRKLTLDVQRMLEQQRAQQARAGGAVSTEKLEGLIHDAVATHVTKAGESMKRALSKEMRDNAQKKLAVAEERLTLAVDRRIESFRPQIDGIEDAVSISVQTTKETSSRLDALQDTLSLLDAEHSAIVSTVRQQEIERASSDHYCYAAIDKLIDMFDKYQHHVLLDKKLQ